MVGQHTYRDDDKGWASPPYLPKVVTCLVNCLVNFLISSLDSITASACFFSMVSLYMTLMNNCQTMPPKPSAMQTPHWGPLRGAVWMARSPSCTTIA